MANLSFASPPSSDNDCGIFTQGYSDPCNDLFDQFLDLDSLDAEGSIFPNPPSSTVLARPRSISGSAGTSRDSYAGHQRTSLELRYKQTVASPPEEPPRCHSNPESSGRAAISDTELLSLEGIRIQTPNIPPLTPCLQSTPTYPLTPSTTGKRHRILDIHNTKPSRKASIQQRRSSLHHTKVTQDPDSHRSPIRKVTSPAKMMRAQQYSEQTLHEWSQRLAEEAKGFQFEFQNSTHPLSPPPSARVSDASTDSQGIVRVAQQHNGFAWDNPVPQYSGRTQQGELHTPMPTPTEQGYSFNHPHQNRNPSIDVSSLQSQHPSGWSQAPMSEYSFAQTAPVDFGEDSDSPVWWAHTTTAPLNPAAPSAFQRSAQHTKTQSLALQLQNELAYNANELALSPSNLPSGLMIQNLPPSPTGQSFIVAGDSSGSSPNLHPSYFGQGQHLGNGMRGGQSPRHRYPQNHGIDQSNAPFGSLAIRKSRQTGRSSSHDDDEDDDSPSPRSSSNLSFPDGKSHRNMGRRHTSAHLSVHPTTHASRSASLGRRAQKSSIGSSHGGHNSGSGMAKAGLVDFVNFTPSDSMKILTGVAPSGSSKTKARREKEAADRRRRLSLAAVRAVKAAGGSIEGLLLEEDGGLLD